MAAREGEGLCFSDIDACSYLMKSNLQILFTEKSLIEIEITELVSTWRSLSMHFLGSNCYNFPFFFCFRPSLVSETGNPGVCISSSYCPSSDHIVASYRPRVVSSDDTVPSQPWLSQTGVSNNNRVDGSHVCLKRRGADSYYQKLSSTRAFVDNIRLPRTAIIDFGEERKQVFASCDESSRELILQDPSTFTVYQRLPLSSHLPLQDVKYGHLNGSGLLGLLTDDRFQLLRN